MERLYPTGLSSILLIVIAFNMGCAGGFAREAARKGALQVSTLESDITAKIKAENEFYNTQQKLADKARANVMSVLLENEITRAAENFVEDNENNPEDVSAETLLTYFNSSRENWQRTVEDIEITLSKAEADLEKGRKELDAEFTKLSQLRSQLTTLGKSRAWRDLMKFLVEYGKATKEQLDELNQ